jgi:DNA primase
MTSNHQHYGKNEDSQTTKYMIYANFNIDGIVEKPDVVGALFGQTEGLLSNELELRELQKGGRIGRIRVILHIRHGKTVGSLQIPSSLDKVETSILAAAVETVDKIGPCSAQITITQIKDVREDKRKKIIERASKFLKNWNEEVTPDSDEIASKVMKAAQVSHRIESFGRLPAGPELNDSDTIIIVEGRADIAACLRAGVRNTVAVQGTSIPRSVSKLTKSKKTIVFLDGDRGGDLILKELLMFGYIDYVARAPTGKEVEDLKPTEIVEQLNKKTPIEEVQFISDIHAKHLINKAIEKKKQKGLVKVKLPSEALAKKKVKQKIEQKVSGTSQSSSSKRKTSRPKPTTQQTRTSSRTKTSSKARAQSSRSSRSKKQYSKSQRSSRKRTSRSRFPKELEEYIEGVKKNEEQQGIFITEDDKEIKRLPVAKIFKELEEAKDSVSKIVFDGIITQRLIDLCNKKKVNILVGAKTGDLERRPREPKIYTFA